MLNEKRNQFVSQEKDNTTAQPQQHTAHNDDVRRNRENEFVFFFRNQSLVCEVLKIPRGC